MPSALSRRSLYQPFQRLGHRSARNDGHGLGLSIVAAIADAHRARITTEKGPEGGLDITVAVPGAGPVGHGGRAAPGNAYP
ncbi:ATP-binding protein [Streptomyces lanatus]|uniref:ATP-binding protein n=1 Tax=Streptomyces lanatus TaxID=66900 RepID=A0ABV1Y3L4_9ACTN|nr:ATP-binding protein [Streptomyces lanatus]